MIVYKRSRIYSIDYCHREPFIRSLFARNAIHHDPLLNLFVALLYHKLAISLFMKKRSMKLNS